MHVAIDKNHNFDVLFTEKK